MSEINIKSMEKENHENSNEIKIEEPTEQDLIIEDNFNPEEEKSSKEDSKNIIVTILIVVGLFALIIVGSNFYNSLTAAEIIDVDELHQKNLEEELDEEEGYTYNGFSFVKVDGMWWTEVKRFKTLVKIPLHFGPKEVEKIPFIGNVNPNFDNGNEIYLSIDPDVTDKYYTLSLTELSFNMAKGINRNPVGACTKKNSACDDREILNCENTKGKPVVEISLANKTEITAQGTCIKISGNGYDLVKATNRVLYMWYGIIQ